LTRKIQRHDSNPTISPPSGGPSASPTPTIAPNAPIARPRSSGGKLEIRSAALFAVIIAAPRPCSARAAISHPTPGAAAHNAEATVNTTRPAP
jgi:hypothetical protein